MRPIPVAFHIGPLELHTYGIGLAITFWFAYRYFAKRLRDHGYADAWLGVAFVWIIVAAILGARAFHVFAHWGFYTAHPADIIAIWQGGLSSYGGLAAAIPVGLYVTHKRCPSLGLWKAADLVTPVLIAAWAVGRLLGPQLMIRGGGKVTHAWFGMYYAGEVGKRLPVPIFQAAECGAVYVVTLAIERYAVRHGGLTGLVFALGQGLWGLSRFFDSYFWLTYNAGTDAIEAVGLVEIGAGIIAAIAIIAYARAHPKATAGVGGESPSTTDPAKPAPDVGLDALTGR